MNPFKQFFLKNVNYNNVRYLYCASILIHATLIQTYANNFSFSWDVLSFFHVLAILLSFYCLVFSIDTLIKDIYLHEVYKYIDTREYMNTWDTWKDLIIPPIQHIPIHHMKRKEKRKEKNPKQQQQKQQQQKQQKEQQQKEEQGKEQGKEQQEKGKE